MYATLTELHRYLGISPATSTSGDDDVLLDELLTRAQRQIDGYCGRSFETTSGIRYYNEDYIYTLPHGSQWRPAGSQHIGVAGYSWDAYPGSYYGSGEYGHTVLMLDKDLRSITGITNGDGTTITSTQYNLEPRNDPPYQYIRLKSGHSWIFDTDGEVAIDGNWGYTTTAPADITQATIRLTAYLYRQKDASIFDVVADPSVGVITVPQGFPADVAKILDEGEYVRSIHVK